MRKPGKVEADTIQAELRRMAGLMDFALYRSTLRLAACKIDELEREVERLRAAQQEGESK